MKITKLPCHSKPAALKWIRDQHMTGLGVLQLFHDDFCKALTTGRDADCVAPCVPDLYLVEPLAASAAQEKAGVN